MEKYDFSKHDKSHYIKYENSYGAIVVAKSFDKVLIAGDGFPKGHAYDGETPAQTAIREVKEETDIDIDEADFILDDNGKPLIFTHEFPWQYGKEMLNLLIAKAVRKQAQNSKERPVWNNTKPLTRRIQLFLVPIEMDKFKQPKPQLSEVSSAAWLTWEDAYKQLSEKNSPSLGLLYEAFTTLKGYKKIRDTELPKPDKTSIKKELEKQRKLMCTPIAKWPKELKMSLDKGMNKDVNEEDETKEEKKEEKIEPTKTGAHERAYSIYPFIIGLVISLLFVMMFMVFCQDSPMKKSITEMLTIW